MLGALVRSGFALSLDPEEADVLIVNTCAFIDAAKRESLDAIMEAIALKPQVPGRKLVVAGCLAQRYGAELKAAFPEVDILIGTGNFLELPRLLRRTPGLLDGNKAESLYPGAAHLLPSHEMPRLLTGNPWSAYVKVSEGCNHKCSFCIIPKIRGVHQSRPLDDVVAEVKALVRSGVREVNLVAQDLTAYGRDLEPRSSLSALLRALAEIENLRWIRLLYCYPNFVTDELLRTIAELPQVVKYIDMPLQHADDQILRVMRRERSVAGLRKLLDRIRSAIPDVVLRTSFIVGFPGEGEAEFARLLDFVREQRFDRVGVFAYSREEGTAAFDLPGQVPERVKQARRRRLMEVQAEISREKNRELVGKEVEVLLESDGDCPSSGLRGRLPGQAPEIDGGVLLRGVGRAGTFVRAKIEKAFTYDLHAKIVNAVT